MLQLQNIHKHLNKIKLLDGISFEIAEKTITGLTGPDGSGKTTLLDIIIGLKKPERGKILFNSRNITRLSLYKRAKLGIIRVFAEQSVFPKQTLLENLVIAFDEPYDHFWRALFRVKTKNRIYYDRKQIIESLLAKLGIHAAETDLMEALPAGQRKLAMIARALLAKPKLIILDEISAGLDEENITCLKDALKKLKKEGYTFLVADQNLDFILDLSDKIIVLSAGEELAMGTSVQLRKNKKVQEAYNN